MQEKVKRSLDRAIKFLNTPKGYENYIVLKIKPQNLGCCCLRCRYQKQKREYRQNKNYLRTHIRRQSYR